MIDRQQENTRSSLFERLPPEVRRTVDVAIIERIPPTFTAIWIDLKLADHGISYSAFYRYARRLRDRANVAEIADLTADADDLETPIQKLLARRALDALVSDDELPPKELSSLLSALRQTTRSVLENRKMADDSRLAWARLEHNRESLQLKLEHLQSTRQRLLGHITDSQESGHLPVESKSDTPVIK